MRFVDTKMSAVGTEREAPQPSPPTANLPVTIVWFRRDLRIDDNPALYTATKTSSYVIPVFIWSPEEEGQFFPGRVSRWWLKQSLSHFRATLAALGTPLILQRSATSLAALLQVIEATRATQVFFNHLYDPVSLVRDHGVKIGLAQRGVRVHSFNADLLYEPWEVMDGSVPPDAEDGAEESSDAARPFTYFQTFWDKCMNMSFQPDTPLPAPKELRAHPVVKMQLTSLSLPIDALGLEEANEKASNALLSRAWVPGWANAERAFVAFVRCGPLMDYAANRAKADTASTSLLSPHLHYGEISVRKIYYECLRISHMCAAEGVPGGVESVGQFLRSLGFREYSRYLSFHFPFTHERSLIANLRSYPWCLDERVFRAWRQGQTGYPLIDAGMKELWATGWLHNRIRVVCASFCVKFLHLPWRWGMKYFWDTLLDADLESDVLGWQYISGSLPDGHELDRMDSPEIEGCKYDPDGEYVRRWLPELSRLPTRWIHHPSSAPSDVLRAAGVELGYNYPLPIVDVKTARDNLQRALNIMWEREASIQAAIDNGVEEGGGETCTIPATSDEEGEEEGEAQPARLRARFERIDSAVCSRGLENEKRTVPNSGIRADVSTVGRGAARRVEQGRVPSASKRQKLERSETADCSTNNFPLKQSNLPQFPNPKVNPYVNPKSAYFTAEERGGGRAGEGGAERFRSNREGERGRREAVEEEEVNGGGERGRAREDERIATNELSFGQEEEEWYDEEVLTPTSRMREVGVGRKEGGGGRKWAVNVKDRAENGVTVRGGEKEMEAPVQESGSLGREIPNLDGWSRNAPSSVQNISESGKYPQPEKCSQPETAVAGAGKSAARWNLNEECDAGGSELHGIDSVRNLTEPRDALMAKAGNNHSLPIPVLNLFSIMPPPSEVTERAAASIRKIECPSPNAAKPVPTAPVLTNPVCAKPVPGPLPPAAPIQAAIPISKSSVEELRLRSVQCRRDPNLGTNLGRTVVGVSEAVPALGPGGKGREVPTVLKSEEVSAFKMTWVKEPERKIKLELDLGLDLGRGVQPPLPNDYDPNSSSLPLPTQSAPPKVPIASLSVTANLNLNANQSGSFCNLTGSVCNQIGLESLTQADLVGIGALHQHQFPLQQHLIGEKTQDIFGSRRHCEPVSGSATQGTLTNVNSDVGYPFGLAKVSNVGHHSVQKVQRGQLELSLQLGPSSNLTSAKASDRENN